MTYREKVIKGLEYHLKELSIGKTCYECPYFGDNPCEIELIANALELLGPVKPIRLNHTEHYQTDDYRCGVCGEYMYYEQHCCEACGVEAKWDDSQ